jgi:hypothetical protein
MWGQMITLGGWSSQEKPSSAETDKRWHDTTRTVRVRETEAHVGFACLSGRYKHVSIKAGWTFVTGIR